MKVGGPLVLALALTPLLIWLPRVSGAAGVDDLISAVWGFDLQKAGELIDGGVDINAKNNKGTTALLLACSYKDNDEMIELLVSRGADVDIRGADGYTPLFFAVRYSPKASELLLSKGADVNAKGNDGTTALMWAGVNGQAKIVELLIARGAEVNAMNENGRTALSWARKRGEDEVVEILKAKGATE